MLVDTLSRLPDVAPPMLAQSGSQGSVGGELNTLAEGGGGGGGGVGGAAAAAAEGAALVEGGSGLGGAPPA
jgi:hypothetical protein